MKIAFLLICGGVFGLLVQGMWLNLLRSAGLVVPNFQGKEIPVSVGPLFLGSAAFAFWLGDLFAFVSLSVFFPFLFLITAMVLLGFIDDTLGSGESRGFRGHFKSLFQGKLTTGGLKAIGGGLLALIVATATGKEPAQILLAALLMALSANTINLLDLRPGRALKFFWLGIVILFFVPGSKLFILLPLVGASLVYAPLDLRAKAMLGDSGSNCLGAALGYSLANSLTWQWQLGVLFFLLLLNLLSERYSFSAIIDQNPVLRFLDSLGRAQ